MEKKQKTHLSRQMKYYKYNNQLGKVTQSYLSVCFQMHKLLKFNNVSICITHHPLLLCRIPRGSQGYSSPNLGASSVRSTRKSSLRDKKSRAKYSRLIPASVDASPQRCPPPSMVAGPGPTLTAVLEHTGDPQDGAQSANIASDTEHRKRRDTLQSAGGTRLNIHEEPRNRCACVVGSVGNAANNRAVCA